MVNATFATFAFEIRVGNVIFFCALPRRRLGIYHKNQQKHVLIVFTLIFHYRYTFTLAVNNHRCRLKNN